MGNQDLSAPVTVNIPPRELEILDAISDEFDMTREEFILAAIRRFMVLKCVETRAMRDDIYATIRGRFSEP